MRRTGLEAGAGEMRKLYRILDGRHEGKNHSEDLDVEGRIILEWILGKWDGKVWTGFI